MIKDDDLCNNCSDYTFGFNNVKFSDRVLVIEIQSQSSDLHSAENGIEASQGDDSSSCSQECSRVTKLHVNSIVLAGKSPFFYNLLSNGMMESERRCVTMKIHASEETAFMELLNYMYSGTLTAITAPALFDVLKLADKFQVVSCMRLCASLLTSLPMTTESALLYLDLTSTLPMTDEIQHVVHAAKRFLTARFRDISKFLRRINCSLKWTETHYPEVEDQRQILSAHLGQYIRSPEKLREVLSCNILDADFAHRAVVDALFFKIKTPRFQHVEEGSASFVRRDYKWRPVKVLEFERPRRELVVYFDEIVF